MNRTIKIISILRKEYPRSKTSLLIRNPLECLIATILSAQCTDKRVNVVTKDLFKKYKKAKDYANSNLKTLEKDLSSINFYKNKSKSIKKTCKILVKEHNGEVPNKLNKLIKLPGVGRKTANVVLGNAFNIHEGYVVDTHNLRLAYRLNLTNNKNPIKVEQDLVKIIPKKDWLDLSHMFIDHGRAVCKAPTPICNKCLLNKICTKIDVNKRK
jgi:endonuclease-3